MKIRKLGLIAFGLVTFFGLAMLVIGLVLAALERRENIQPSGPAAFYARGRFACLGAWSRSDGYGTILDKGTDFNLLEGDTPCSQEQFNELDCSFVPAGELSGDWLGEEPPLNAMVEIEAPSRTTEGAYMRTENGRIYLPENRYEGLADFEIVRGKFINAAFSWEFFKDGGIPRGYAIPTTTFTIATPKGVVVRKFRGFWVGDLPLINQKVILDVGAAKASVQDVTLAVKSRGKETELTSAVVLPDQRPFRYWLSRKASKGWYRPVKTGVVLAKDKSSAIAQVSSVAGNLKVIVSPLTPF